MARDENLNVGEAVVILWFQAQSGKPNLRWKDGIGVGLNKVRGP
jgi:hypothetical protein